MSLTLYMDVHVPRAITNGLRQRGIEVITAQEDGFRTADDSILLDRATGLGCPLFTQDEDLLAEAKRRQSENTLFAGVIYAHQQYITIGTCVRDLELLTSVFEPEDMSNRVEFLPL